MSVFTINVLDAIVLWSRFSAAREYSIVLSASPFGFGLYCVLTHVFARRVRRYGSELYRRVVV